MKTRHALIIGLLIVLCIGLAVDNWQLRQTGVVYVPSVIELQKIVGCEKIDGKVSDDWRNSETQKKSDLYYGQQSADISINKETMR